jgi:aspartyl protease family protein
MRPILIFAALALAAGFLVPRYAAQIGSAQPPIGSDAPPSSRVAATANSSRSIVVPRDERGHFRVEARVDGRPLRFMVDTGASVIALTETDAAKLGIRPAQRDFSAEVKTANGTVRAAPAKLNTVTIGDLVVHNVDALVLPDRALSDNLLGLSFLSRLRRFEYSDGRLVLEQ